MQDIIQNYRVIEQQLAQLQKNLTDKANNTLILPVSKRKPASNIRTLYEIGIRHFAENYLQEAQQKKTELRDCPEIQWHYIGKIQSKKCKHLAQQMAWVHTVDNLQQATLLDTHSAQANRNEALNICIQVNLHQETQKNGIEPAQVVKLSEQIATLPNLRLRGLMLIGRAELTTEQQAESFKQMQKLFQICQQRLTFIDNNTYDIHQYFDTLSMGMSDDWQTAVTHGSTIIRLGTTIFGQRESSSLMY